jgi:hypothetical protein
LKYNLENLHWKEFEQLVIFYLKEVIGEGTWSSDGSKDSGRDAEFKGTANEYPSKTSPWKGNWIFQVKHRTTKSSTSLKAEQGLLRDLSKELKKIFVKHRFKCDNYIYVTNLNVSNNFRTQAAAVFSDFFKASFPKRSKCNFAVLEYKDLEPHIDKSPFLKRAFPPLLTFNDLETVFLKKEETRNKGYLRSATKGMRRFVSTHHYTACVDILASSHFLMLVGDPKSGKTTIVEALALAFLEEGGFKPYFIRNTDEFFTITAYLPPNENALFICDDIFGKHELETGKLTDWTDYFQSVLGSVDEHHRFVFTTRKYIYQEFARKSGLATLFPGERDPNRFIIKLATLKRDEREQILEKHLEQSDLPSAKIDQALGAREEILNCPDFSPEVIRSLVALLKSKPLDEAPKVISDHLSQPNKYLYDFFDEISDDKQLLLVSVAVAPKKDTSKVESRFLRLLRECSMTPEVRFSVFIDELDGSIVRKLDYVDSSEVDYYHPSMYDVMVGIFGNDLHYRSLMLKNVNLDLLWLLTLQTSSKKPNAIQIDTNDFEGLNLGLQQFLTEDAALRDAAAVLQWIASSLNNDSLLNLTFRPWVSQVNSVASCALRTNGFFEARISEPLEQWVNLFARWRNIPTGDLPYKEKLRDLHRVNPAAKYYRLMFALESVSPGLISKESESGRLNQFATRLSKSVKGLRLGLNPLPGGKLDTDEDWLATFFVINDLINHMKRSAAGRQIFNSVLLDDWEKIRLHSETARLRHFGKVKVGHWKSTPSIKGIGSDKLWDSVL